MADEQPKMIPTLGLTGVTVNAMALIAPGAFLWITFVLQAGYVFPSGLAMWFGILVALSLAYATAISYAELAKLYPGAGSSYLFAEQAFLGKTHAYRFARIAKFIIGWASHLYYWVYPAVMVATMGVMVGYIVGNIFPNTINPGTPGPLFMALIAIIFSYFVAFIAYRGVSGSTNVNIAINAIQIAALLFFSALAIAYRISHPEGSAGLALDSAGNVIKTVVHYSSTGDSPAHTSALSVIAPHRFDWVMLQATIAILLLVGFESVTALGEEAKNPKKDIPRGVLLSLTIQGLICYMFEYFAANYFLQRGYSLAAAKGVRGANRRHDGDRRQCLVGWTWSSLHVDRGLHRVPGPDRHHSELHQHRRAGHLRDGPGRGSSRALRHAARREPHPAPRDLGFWRPSRRCSGAYAAIYFFAGGSAPDDKAIAALPHNLWYAVGMSSNAYLATLPNGLLLVTLVSQLRYLRVVRSDQHSLHGGVLRTSRLPWLQAHGGANLRCACQLRMYGLLYYRSNRRPRQRERTLDGGWAVGNLGHLWRNLLRA